MEDERGIRPSVFIGLPECKFHQLCAVAAADFIAYDLSSKQVYDCADVVVLFIKAELRHIAHPYLIRFLYIKLLIDAIPVSGGFFVVQVLGTLPYTGTTHIPHELSNKTFAGLDTLIA